MLIKRAPMFQWMYSSIAATRPSSTWGALVTPGNNTMGTAVEIISGANLAQDCWLLEIGYLTGPLSGSATSTILDVLVDPAGGSSYTAVISSLPTGGAAAPAGSVQPPVYTFPLKIKAGSSVAVKASQNNASPTTTRVFMKAWGLPKHPEHCRSGSFVRTFGDNRAASGGTAITCGGASEGAWTSVGTSSDVLWHWVLGVGVDNAAQASLMYAFDMAIGDGTNYRQVVSDLSVGSQTTETFIRGAMPSWASSYEAVSGAGIYVRGQCSGATDTGIYAIGFGVGGGN